MDTPQNTSNPASGHTNPVPLNPVENEARTTAAALPQDTAMRPAALQQLAQANFIRPRAKLARWDLEVDPGSRSSNANTGDHFAEFVIALYNYLSQLIILSNGLNAVPMSRDRFARMCQTLLAFRVQQVREHRLAQRAAANRISLTRTFPVPAALYEILAGIGEIYLEHRGFSYVPNLPAVPSPIPDYYTVDATIAGEFIRFMDILNHFRLHRSVTFPSQYEGTPFWVLRRVMAGNLVSVTGTTDEGTPADGLLRAMIDIGDGDQDDRDGFVYIDAIDYQTLRHSYFSMN